LAYAIDLKSRRRYAVAVTMAAIFQGLQPSIGLALAERPA